MLCICVKVLGVTSLSDVFTVTPGLCFNVVMVPSFNPNNLLAGQYLSSCNKWHLVPSASYQNVRHFMRCGKIGMVPQMVHRSVEPLRTNSCLLVWKDSWKKNNNRETLWHSNSLQCLSVHLSTDDPAGAVTLDGDAYWPLILAEYIFWARLNSFSHTKDFGPFMLMCYTVQFLILLFVFLLDRWSCKN